MTDQPKGLTRDQRNYMSRVYHRAQTLIHETDNLQGAIRSQYIRAMVGLDHGAPTQREVLTYANVQGWVKGPLHALYEHIEQAEAHGMTQDEVRDLLAKRYNLNDSRSRSRDAG